MLLPDRPHPECEPLTCTRPLGDCPVANLPLRAQVRGELESAGFDLTTAPPAGHSRRCMETCPTTIWSC